MTTETSPATAGRIVGALYIAGTSFGIGSLALLGPTLGADDPLASAADNAGAVTGGGFVILAMAISLALIPVFAYPVLKQAAPALARAHALLRGVVEFGAYLPLVASYLVLATLAEAGGDPALGVALVDTARLEGVVAAGFLAGATAFYLALWRGRLVPRWLAGWGLVAIAPYAVAAALVTSGSIESTGAAAVAMFAALGLQEMVLAVWLLVRGFRAPQAAAAPATAYSGSTPALVRP